MDWDLALLEKTAAESGSPSLRQLCEDVRTKTAGFLVRLPPIFHILPGLPYSMLCWHTVACFS